jgi:hypothetical protein
MTEGDQAPQSGESERDDVAPGSIYSVPVTSEQGEDVSQPATSKNAEDNSDPMQK